MVDLLSLTTVQMVLYIIMLCMVTMSVSFAMEIYKKSLRKGKSSVTENKILGFLLSALVSFGMIKLGMFHPIFVKIGANVIFDEVVLCICLYIAQMQMDMKVFKNLIQLGASSLLKKSGLSDAEVKAILEAVNTPKEETSSKK